MDELGALRGLSPEVQVDGPLQQQAGPLRSRRSAEWALWGVLGAYSCVVWGWSLAYLVLTVDDSFYYWEVAERLAAGQGATFDGVEPTDGYHPLWLGVVAVLQRVGGLCAPHGMRAVLSLQLGLVGAAFVALGRNKRLPLGAVCAVAALLLSAVYAAKILVNGQESALQLFLLVAGLLGFWRAQRPETNGWWQGVVTGGFFGLCALSRLESLLCGLAAVAYLLSERGATVSGRGRAAGFGCLAGLTAVFLPFFVYHLEATGHWGPVSGAVKASRVATISPAVRIVSCAALVGGFVGCVRFSSLFHALFPLLVYVLGLSVYLVGVRGVGFPGIWYLPPYLLLACIGVAYGSVRFRDRVAGRLRRWRLGAIGLWLLFAGLQWTYRLLPTSANRYTVAAEVGGWLDEMLPAKATVASWDAGIVGAHAQLPVSNLDGLVNSWRYHDEYLVQNATDAYLSAQGIDYIAQYFRRSWFENGSLQYRGVDLSDWRVVRAHCYQQRVVGSFWRISPQAFLLLSRGGEGTPLRELKNDWQRLCQSGRSLSQEAS